MSSLGMIELLSQLKGCHTQCWTAPGIPITSTNISVQCALGCDSTIRVHPGVTCPTNTSQESGRIPALVLQSLLEMSLLQMSAEHQGWIHTLPMVSHVGCHHLKHANRSATHQRQYSRLSPPQSAVAGTLNAWPWTPGKEGS